MVCRERKMVENHWYNIQVTRTRRIRIEVIGTPNDIPFIMYKLYSYNVTCFIFTFFFTARMSNFELEFHYYNVYRYIRAHYA
jgi:hypothetical protein